MPHINVKINDFEGPFDLLYHLIEKNEMDIYDIPISILTGQYMDFINELSFGDMDNISEFLLMAATLLEIKSKMLLPSARDDEEETDPREELVEMLIEYKRFKEASEVLKERENNSQFIYYKKPEHNLINLYKAKPLVADVLNFTTLDRLREIFEDVLKRQELKTDKIRGNFGTIKKDIFTVPQKMAYITELIELHEKVVFSSIFQKDSTKEEIIITFWAVLELLKIKTIMIKQENTFSDIIIQSYREE